MKSAGGFGTLHDEKEMVSPSARPSSRTWAERNRDRIEELNSRRKVIFTETGKALDFWVDTMVTYLANWAYASDHNPIIRRILYDEHDRIMTAGLFVPGRKTVRLPQEWSKESVCH